MPTSGIYRSIYVILKWFKLGAYIGPIYVRSYNDRYIKTYILPEYLNIYRSILKLSILTDIWYHILTDIWFLSKIIFRPIYVGNFHFLTDICKFLFSFKSLFSTISAWFYFQTLHISVNIINHISVDIITIQNTRWGRIYRSIYDRYAAERLAKR